MVSQEKKKKKNREEKEERKYWSQVLILLQLTAKYTFKLNCWELPFSDWCSATEPGSFCWTEQAKLLGAWRFVAREGFSTRQPIKETEGLVSDPLRRRQGTWGIYGIRNNAARQSKVWRACTFNKQRPASLIWGPLISKGQGAESCTCLVLTS